MIPILYESTETEFDSNGLGRLRDCISCTVTEERNGIYECDFKYPVNGIRFDDIKLGRIIACRHDYNGDVQPFDIVSYSKPIDGVVAFHAVHISYRLTKVAVNGKSIKTLSSAFNRLSNKAMPNDSGFSYESDMIVESLNYVGAFDGIPKSVRSVLGGVEGSILDTYGGEYEFNKFRVILHKNRGIDRDISIRYGVNLLSYNDELDYSETFNSCVAYWKGSDADGNDLIVKTGLIRTDYESYNERTEVACLDLTDKFEEKPSVSELKKMAVSYITNNQTYLPTQSIELDFVNLRDVYDYNELASIYTCCLCDTVKVIFPQHNVNGRYKIVKMTYDVLADRVTNMELGNLSMTLSQALGLSNVSSQVNGISGVGNIVLDVSADNVTVGATSYVQGMTIDVAQEGYAPLGIVGFRISNASTSGQNASYISVYRSQISEETLTYALRNFASSDAKVKVIFTILYKTITI